jgi:hypothetical protein
MDTNKYLDEANIGGSLAEALTAHVKTVFSDDGKLIGCGRITKNIKLDNKPTWENIKFKHYTQNPKLTAHSAAASSLRSVELLGVGVGQSFGSHG